MILEICIDSIESALAAETGGADRLEVCNSLAAGGTTPSMGLVRRCIEETGLPVMMMIRPHDGTFVYGEQDLRVMIDDISAGIEAGVAGFVFGCLRPNGSLNKEQNRQLLSIVGDRQSTFHRAFDVASSPETPVDVLDQLIELGFDRLLTSGKSQSALIGSGLIQTLVQHADGRIKILAGAGVAGENVAEIVQRTGVSELHASASESCVGAVVQDSNNEVSFGGARRVTSEKKVRAIVDAISQR